MLLHQVQKKQPVQFIVATSSHPPGREQQQLIRSHVSRGRVRKRHRPQLKSWIMQRNGSPSSVDDQYISIPSRVGWDLSFVDFPIEIQPYMQGNLALALSPLKEALYPPEICFQVDPLSSSWTTMLLMDPMYLHCTLFSVESYLDLCQKKSHSPLTHFHFQKTIRLLQARLDSPDDPQSISDPTIMVVSVLGLTAELTGDNMAAMKHMEGLRKMVDLRGGLEMLRFSNSRLPAKVCRIDLLLALRFGIKPVFFSSKIPWKPFLVNHDIISKTSSISVTNEDVFNFLGTLDEKLVNIWKDLKEFSHICNLATQTPHKLPPNTFSEIMISILYRLLGLTFKGNTLAEAIRVGMIAFGAGIFFQWRGIKQRLAHLDNLSRKSLVDLQASQGQVPPLIVLWLLVIQITTISQLPVANDLTGWIENVMSQLCISNQMQAHRMLKSVMWIDYIHNELLKNIAISDSKVIITNMS